MSKKNIKKNDIDEFSTLIFTEDDFDDILYGDDYFSEEGEEESYIEEYAEEDSDGEEDFEDAYFEDDEEEITEESFLAEYGEEEEESEEYYDEEGSEEESEEYYDEEDSDEEDDYYEDEEDDNEVVYFDDEEDESAEMEEAPAKKKGLKVALLSIVGILILAYVGISVYFMSHFYPETVLNGTNVAMYTVAEVEELQEKEAQNYVMKLLESDGDTTLVKGTDIDVVYQRDGKVKEILKTQNPFLWISFLWKEPVINEPVSVSYDAAKLNKLVDKMDCMKEENQSPSISGHPELEGKQFVIVDEQIGTELDRAKFVAAIEGGIEEFVSELDLVEADVYYHAKFDAQSPEVAKACDEMNAFLGAEVTLEFTPHKEVVGAEVISEWIHFDEDMKVTFSKEDVKAYVKSLAEKYDTYGKKRSFVTGYGKTVEVSGGNYGWKIDQEKEYETLLANVEKKEIITREPVYKHTALSHEGYDFGNTYVEVDLSNQHMFFFKDGKCVLDSPIVTGNPNAGNATPQGTYSIAYKQMHVNLRGPKLEDGTYEWDSPVTYWMPFNGGIGLHDATWQSSFGGSRYTWAGSHGCVNLPWSTADKLYPMVEAGTPVICHY